MTDATDLQAVRASFAQHKDALIEQTGAQGAGVGRSKNDPRAYAFVLYVSAAPKAGSAPSVIDGVPVEFVVSDGLRPLGA